MNLRALALAAVLVVAVGWPLVRLVVTLVAHPSALVGAWTPIELRSAWNTAVLSLGTTTFALAAGIPLGFALSRTPMQRAPAWRAVATLPYVIPPHVMAIAWIALLNPTNGWLNGPLRALGAPPLDIYGLPGMIWVMGLEHAPIVWLATADALARSDPALEEQARISGASRWGVLTRITLPLAGPSILNAAALVLASSAAAFGVPYLLASGAASPDYVLTTRIAQALQLPPEIGQPRAVALAAGLLLLSLGAPAALTLPLRGRSFATVGGKGTRPPAASASWARFTVTVYVLLGVVVPLSALLALSLVDQVGLGFGPANWSLDGYAAMLARPSERAAFARSVALAGGAATITLGLAVFVAWSAVRTKDRGRRALSWLSRLPYAVPGTVLALGMLLAWSQELRIPLGSSARLVFSLADTAWLLLLAYAVKLLAVPVGSIEAALRGLDPALEEAARVAGASSWSTFALVTGPLLRPALVSSWFLVFVPAFTEVTMSVLLAGPQTRVVGVVLFDLQTYGDPPGAAALAVIVAAVSIGGQLLAGRIGRRPAAAQVKGERPWPN